MLSEDGDGLQGLDLNVQRAIGNWSSLQVGYVGQRGIKLFSLLEINQPNGPAAACFEGGGDYFLCEQQNRPFFNQFPFLGETTEFGNAENSSYDGLQVTYKTRSWKGLNVVAGCTYAPPLINPPAIGTSTFRTALTSERNGATAT